MLLPTTPLRHLLLVLFSASATLAQDVVKASSFGYDKTLSPNSFGIPGWSMLGEGHVPSLLSDKVILTPAHGGNKRGAVWAEQKNTLRDWSLDFEFRAGGQDRGSGTLAIWYVADGGSVVSTASPYGVGRFDGLVLLIDTHSGVQSIRGFLNDGSTDYRNHQNVDGLAFGHCDYNYRNLGRPSKIRMVSTGSGFEVEVDDRPCFSTNKLTLPPDYTFGMTASSGDPPDSFEVFKFILKSNPASSIQPPSQQQQQQQQQIQQQQYQSNDQQQYQPNLDAPASSYTTSQAQFEDLHSRLHLLSKAITNLFTEITRHTAAEEARYQDILRVLSSSPQQNQQSGSGPDIASRLTTIERTLLALEADVRASDHRGNFQKLSAQLHQTHQGISEHLPNRMREYVQEHTPRIGFIVFSFIGFQCALVVAYVLYKRRRAQAPKKYL